MTKIKHFTLGLLGAVLVTVSLFSCSNDQVNNQQEEFNTTTSAKADEEFDQIALATVDGSAVTPLYDEVSLRAALVSEGFYDLVESVDVDYNFDSNTYEAYFTVIGSKDGLAIAYQAELIKEGRNLFITNPIMQPNFFNKHTCAGSVCSSCDFVKGGWLKITGCTCNEVAIEGGHCNHTKSKDLIGGAIQFVSLVIGIL